MKLKKNQRNMIWKGKNRVCIYAGEALLIVKGFKEQCQ